MKLIQNPIILALDVDDKNQSLKVLDEVADLVGCVKLGPRLINKYGAELVEQIARQVPVFVDNKYFDIPSTMVAAVRQSFEAGATLVTVHAMAGAEALHALADLESKLNQIRPFKVLCVTVLTSWDQKNFPVNFQSWSVQEHVTKLTSLIVQSGLSGIVCSAHELSILKQPGLFKVTPGIRLGIGESQIGQDDQKRIMTPVEAIKSGASGLVIGRPILQAQNPREKILEILKSI